MINEHEHDPIPIAFHQESCIICLEHVTNKDPPFFTVENSSVEFQCQCRPKIHKTCMVNWISQENACPICLHNLRTIVEHVRTTHDANRLQYSYNSHFYLMKVMCSAIFFHCMLLGTILYLILAL